MKIVINNKLTLHLPTKLLLSRWVLGNITKNVDSTVDEQQLREILLLLRKNSRQYKGWILLEAEESGGNTVRIVL